MSTKNDNGVEKSTNPKDLNGRERESGKTVGVLEGEADEEGEGLHDVSGEEVEHEFRDAECEERQLVTFRGRTGGEKGRERGRRRTW